MGQFYLVVNLDKRQYIHPQRFGNGLKLLEFGNAGDAGTMGALAILLADGNGRGAGGGDLHSSEPIVGSWAGDRIVIAGDYADKGKWGVEDADETLYQHATRRFQDVSYDVINAMMDDATLHYQLCKRSVHIPGAYRHGG